MIESEYYAKIKPYRDSLIELRKINQVCEKCNGRGEIIKIDSAELIVCPNCGGTGCARKESYQ